ncbi:CBS domain-containing protein CBSX5-like [Asparagus officinalis]|uniref:CBS domain-containing protein CBSX5-like n=1 Tax=Asparagus officinalis TaxID=4686 RepID=UPI00098DF202|nr:CBS domain-containing protein CBSX5-like [Asparagus officinalis]
MAVCLQSNVASDLCIGKPSLRSIPITASVGEALVALREWGEAKLGVALGEKKSKDKAGGIVGDICMVDVLCYLCSQQNIKCPVSALQNPVSVLLSKGDGVVRAIDPDSRYEFYIIIVDYLEFFCRKLLLYWMFWTSFLMRMCRPPCFTIDASFAFQKQKHQEFSWLTQEDLLRFFLNNISSSPPSPPLRRRRRLAAPTSSPSTTSLRRPRPPPPPLALLDGRLRRVVTDDRKLIGDIPPSILSGLFSDDTVAPAVASLSVAELMAYIDDCCSHRSASEPALQRVKARLQEEGLTGMLGFLEGNEVTFPMSPSSSDDDESVKKSRKPRRMRSGSYMGRRSEEVAVCYEESSLVAVMVQALAHRVNYVWVVDDEEEFGLVGIVTFQDMLRVFREQIQ